MVGRLWLLVTAPGRRSLEASGTFAAQRNTFSAVAACYFQGCPLFELFDVLRVKAAPDCAEATTFMPVLGRLVLNPTRGVTGPGALL